MSSERWKSLERTAARKLRGRRVIRRWDLFESAPDVVAIDGFPLVVDAKAYKRFAHHGLMQEIERKALSRHDGRSSWAEPAESLAGYHPI